jgi:hypothetical protein
MSKTIVSLAAFREDMLRLGYHVRVTRYADFGKARVCHSRGPINNGNVVTPEHLAEHAGFYDYAARHAVREGGYVIVI